MEDVAHSNQTSREPATEFGKRNRYLEKLIPDALENAVDSLLPDALEKMLDRGCEKAYREFSQLSAGLHWS